MSIHIDIIITTYNRAMKVNQLCAQLLSNAELSGKINVVDSSDNADPELMRNGEVKYIRSSHKNQPYQRYLGYLASDADILIFLDDDMEVVDQKFYNKIAILFQDTDLAGVAIKFIDKHQESSLSQIPHSSLFTYFEQLKIIKGCITGYPALSEGKFGLCGNRGKQPAGGGPTEWVSGGAFAAKRSAMFQNFNFQLFDIFEKRMGMGEDGIIGYGLSKQGKLVFQDELFFLHNDQKDSTYSMDTIAFAKRVAFSRLYLSLEKTRLDNGSRFIARLHYNWYMVWRISGLIINYLAKRTPSWKMLLTGSLQGWKNAVALHISDIDKNTAYWKLEATIDLTRQEN